MGKLHKFSPLKPMAQGVIFPQEKRAKTGGYGRGYASKSRPNLDETPCQGSDSVTLSLHPS